MANICTRNSGVESVVGVRQPMVEALRALAIVAVVANHVAPNFLPGGFLGVDVFFVISGYVISKVITGNVDKKGFLSDFYAKRFARITPLFTVVILFGTILSVIFIDPLSISYWTNITTSLSSIFGLSNIFLVLEQSNYFSSLSNYNVFTHTWSLCVEMQFYLLFPIIFIMTKRLGKIRREKVTYAVILFSCVLSFALFVYLYNKNPMFSYYLMPTRFWEFGAGSLSFYLGKKITINSFKIGHQLLVISIFAACIMMMISDRYILYTAPLIVLSISIALVLIGFSNTSRALHKNFVLQLIGKLSYSVYLWHWVIISIFRWTIGINILNSALAVVITVAISVVSNRLVEIPSKRFLNRQKSKWVHWIWFYATTFSFIVLFFVGFGFRGELFAGKSIDSNGHTKSIFSSGCDVRSLAEKNGSQKLKCSFAINDYANTVFLVGDSHAKQFEDPIQMLTKNNRTNFRSFWGSGCIFPPIHTSDEECKNGGAIAENLIVQDVQKGDLVIVGNQMLNYLSTDNAKIDDEMTREDVVSGTLNNEYFSNLEEFASTISKKQANLIFYTDSVQFPNLQIGALCAKEWFRPVVPTSCFRDLHNFKETYKPVMDKVEMLRVKGLLTVWDGMRWSQCFESLCNATKMSDSNHFVDWYTWQIVQDSKNLFANND
jgi:peptidoglycan/LPS O-acetylase OafA/YrhL